MKKIFSIFLSFFLSLLLLINSFLKEKNFIHACDIKSLIEKYHNGFETKNFWWFDILLFKTSEGNFQETDIKKKIEPGVRFFVKNVFQNEDGAVWGSTLIDDKFYFIPGKFLTFVKDNLPYTFRFTKFPCVYQTENEFENCVTRNTPVKEVKIYENNNITRGFDVALSFSKIKAMGCSGGYTFFAFLNEEENKEAEIKVKNILCAKNEDLEEDLGKLDFKTNIFDIYEEFVNNTSEQIKCDKGSNNHDNSDLIIEPGQKVTVTGEYNSDFYSLQDGKFFVDKNLLIPVDLDFFAICNASICDENFNHLKYTRHLYLIPYVLKTQGNFLIFKEEDHLFSINKTDVTPMKNSKDWFRNTMHKQAISMSIIYKNFHFAAVKEFFIKTTLNYKKLPALYLLQQVFLSEYDPWSIWNSALMSFIGFLIFSVLNPIDLVLKNEDILFIKKIFLSLVVPEISKYLEEMPSKQEDEYELFYNFRKEIIQRFQ
jgi:hypothetical protein